MGSDFMWSKRRLIAALVAGLLLQALLLAFGLHTGLVLADLCRGSLSCYWTLNGVYLVIGLATMLLVVPWTTIRVRLAVFTGLAAIGLMIGILSIPSSP
jgi:hypothetical protein